MPVTTRQRQVFEYISRFIEVKKHAPTISQIGRHFGMSSPASVHNIIAALEREGLITKIPNVSRGIEIVKQETATDDEYEIPLLGRVAAGQPIEAILSHETIAVPRNMTGRGRLYALRVRGDPEVGDELFTAERTQDDVRVADIDDDQHSILLTRVPRR